MNSGGQKPNPFRFFCRKALGCRAKGARLFRPSHWSNGYFREPERNGLCEASQASIRRISPEFLRKLDFHTHPSTCCFIGGGIPDKKHYIKAHTSLLVVWEGVVGTGFPSERCISARPQDLSGESTLVPRRLLRGKLPDALSCGPVSVAAT